MSKFSELAGLPTTTHESGVTKTSAPPVTSAPPEPVAPPVYENPLDQMPVASDQEPPRAEEEIAEVTAPPVEPEIPTNLKWLSKLKLEEIGRSVGIELDRRLSQPKLVEQLEQYLADRGE